MARPVNQKCLECAGLSPELARTLHGVEGDGCWNDKRCHNRRSFYRQRSVRLDLSRRNRATSLGVELPSRAAAYLYLFGSQRSRLAPGQAVSKRRSPHSLMAELYVDGVRIWGTEPVHCAGLTSRQLDRYVRDILETFSDAAGEELTEFARVFERDEADCPIAPCPARMWS